jgi:hypothetical protein
MPIKNMTKEQIAEATRATVTAGGKSTDPNNRLKGETATEANARITAAYKELTAKPILTQEQIDAGMKVQFVREGAGGVGMYTAIKPVGYTGPTEITNFTKGIIPEGTEYATGSAVGLDTGGRSVDEFRKILIGKKVTGNPLTIKEQQWLDANPEGSSIPSVTTKTVDTLAGKTPDQIAAYNNAKATAQQFVDLYGGNLNDYFDSVTGKVTSPSKDVINKKLAGSPNTKNVVETAPKDDGTSTITFDEDSTEVSETTSVIKSLQNQINSLTKQLSSTTGTTKTTEAETTRRNAIDVLTERFQRYGLGSLVNKIKDLAVDGATEATITLGLQETEEYKTRFKANQARIKKGLQVLNPAEYLNVEDGYRQVLRAYGLKQFDTDDYVSQFIANDVSATELSNRVVTAVQRVQNADPAISQQLRDFYGIGQADLVAYVLDPNQQFQKIERQVAASEIGVAAARQGLKTGVSVAEQLAAQGVTQAEAQKGYATIADILPTAEKLSDIYGKTLDGYGQSEAEQEVFNSLASAQRKRQKLTQREIASFSGAAGTNKTSLTTSAVGQF